MTTSTINFDQPRTITVERTEVLKQGTKNGKPWTLYRVYASEKGKPVPEELRSFDALPTGDVEVTAEARVVDDKIESYTLKPTRPTKRNGGPDQSDRIIELESRVTTLERKLNALLRAADVEF